MITSLCRSVRLTVVRNHGTFSFVTMHQAGLREACSQSAGSPPDEREQAALDESEGKRNTQCALRCAHMLNPAATSGFTPSARLSSPSSDVTLTNINFSFIRQTFNQCDSQWVAVELCWHKIRWNTPTGLHRAASLGWEAMGGAVL